MQLKTNEEYIQQFKDNIEANKIKYNKDKFTMEEYGKILFPNKVDTFAADLF